MEQILFLGDSITDCGHCFTSDNLGSGYVKMIASRLSGYQILNGGTDGFTFPRILGKWQQFYSQLNPALTVVAAGINDVSMAAEAAAFPGASKRILEHSARAFSELLNALLPCTSKILVIEPFLFPEPACLILWQPYLDDLRLQMRKLVSLYPAGQVQCLAVQPELDHLAAVSGIPAVSPDGVHLTRSGHLCLCRQILTAISGWGIL